VFVLRHGLEMLAHTFTGESVLSILGLEKRRAVFERFRATRRRERNYLEVSPATPGKRRSKQAA
jgi:hypothetical protein